MENPRGARRFSPWIAATLLAVAMAPEPARAWRFVEHRPYRWPTEDLPIAYWVGGADTCEATVGVDACIAAPALAHRAWDEGAPCAGLGGGRYLGELSYVDVDDPDPPLGEAGLPAFLLGDDRNHVTYGDPTGELEVGVLGSSLVLRQGHAFVLDGVELQWAVEADIAVNDLVDLATPAEIARDCRGRTNLYAVMTHEVGHLYGLGHACAEDEACTDPELAGALMNWVVEPCDPRHDVREDDIAGIEALYGPSLGFTCSHEIAPDLALGTVPFELKCALSSDHLHEIASVEWTFGNGDSASGTTASTTYTEAGTHTVSVSVLGQADRCVEADNPGGHWSASALEVGYVRACDLPVVGFQVEHVDGLRYQVVNTSDVSVYGCIQDIAWQVHAGPGVGAPLRRLTTRGWEPEFTFPEPGTYTIVLNAGGPAGTSAAALTLRATDRPGAGYGCASTGRTGGATALLATLGAIWRRGGSRRRSGRV